jgi:protein-disulfide isomerase
MLFDVLLRRSPRTGVAAALAAFVIAAPLLSAPAKAAEFTKEQKTEIGKIVRDYIVANPEVIKEAIEELEKREKAAEADVRKQALAKNAELITNSVNQAVVGNPNGDVTLIEFFDYNCGYCKQSLENVSKLVESDPKLRVVLKDFAILGPDSVEVAEVASALRTQFKGQKFWDFHKKLLSTKGHIGKAQALAAAKELGADTEKLEKDMKSPEILAGLKEVNTLADELRFTGTPSWIIGPEAIVGSLPLSEMKKKVDSVRKCGTTAC